MVDMVGPVHNLKVKVVDILPINLRLHEVFYRYSWLCLLVDTDCVPSVSHLKSIESTVRNRNVKEGN